jgi:hypothetical protein
MYEFMYNTTFLCTSLCEILPFNALVYERSFVKIKFADSKNHTTFFCTCLPPGIVQAAEESVPTGLYR